MPMFSQCNSILFGCVRTLNISHNAMIFQILTEVYLDKVNTFITLKNPDLFRKLVSHHFLKFYKDVKELRLLFQWINPCIACVIINKNDIIFHMLGRSTASGLYKSQWIINKGSFSILFVKPNGS